MSSGVGFLRSDTVKVGFLRSDTVNSGPLIGVRSLACSSGVIGLSWEIEAPGGTVPWDILLIR